MARRKISQTEAWQLFHENRRLRTTIKNQRNAWAREFPDGIHIGTTQLSDVHCVAIKTARKLGHAVVVAGDGNDIYFYALPLPTTEP